MNHAKIDQYRKIMDMAALGLTADEIVKLEAIERGLRRWFTMECNGEVQRDETTMKPHWGGKPNCPVQDMERINQKRLEKIQAAHRDLWFYIQGDPRGGALYVGKKKDMDMRNLSSLYNRGICV